MKLIINHEILLGRQQFSLDEISMIFILKSRGFLKSLKQQTSLVVSKTYLMERFIRYFDNH